MRDHGSPGLWKELQQLPQSTALNTHVTALNTHITPVCECTNCLCHAPIPDLGGYLFFFLLLLLLLLLRAECCWRYFAASSPGTIK